MFGIFLPYSRSLFYVLRAASSYWSAREWPTFVPPLVCYNLFDTYRFRETDMVLVSTSLMDIKLLWSFLKYWLMKVLNVMLYFLPETNLNSLLNLSSAFHKNDQSILVTLLIHTYLWYWWHLIHLAGFPSTNGGAYFFRHSYLNVQCKKMVSALLKFNHCVC